MKCFVNANGSIKVFNCSFKELPENYKNFPTIQYKTNQMSCTGYSAIFNSNWKLEDSYNERVRLIDPNKEVRELGFYLPDYVRYIFKIIEFPNWSIADKFLALEKSLKEKDSKINYLERENERLKEKMGVLKKKITKRNRLIRKLRGNCQAIIIQTVTSFFACQDLALSLGQVASA